MRVRSTTRFLVLAGLAAALLAGCGKAPGTALWTDEVFAGLDRDGDGRLSQAEARLSAAGFKELDRNGDGAVSRLEWRSGGAPTLTGATTADGLTRPDAAGPRTW